jgi:hypothetical protein
MPLAYHSHKALKRWLPYIWDVCTGGEKPAGSGRGHAAGRVME